MSVVAAHAAGLGATPSEAVLALGDLMVVPEFLGNRSPFAEPEARAVISGLGLDRGMDSLARLYIAGLSGIGYGLRQLLDRFSQNGIAISTIVASGGAAQSDLSCQILADSTGLAVALPEAPEPVLLGSAILAALASGQHVDADAAMSAMSGAATLFHPAQGTVTSLHSARYQMFTALQSAARGFRDLSSRIATKVQ